MEVSSDSDDDTRVPSPPVRNPASKAIAQALVEAEVRDIQVGLVKLSYSRYIVLMAGSLAGTNGRIATTARDEEEIAREHQVGRSRAQACPRYIRED